MSFLESSVSTTEVTQLIGNLESKLILIEREVLELSDDVARTQTLLMRYGEVYRQPLLFLMDLRARKVQAKQEIGHRLGLFEENLEKSTQLVKSLSNNHR